MCEYVSTDEYARVSVGIHMTICVSSVSEYVYVRE